MMVTWTKVVAVEWEDSSGWVDNLDGKCEREKAMIVPRFQKNSITLIKMRRFLVELATGDYQKVMCGNVKCSLDQLELSSSQLVGYMCLFGGRGSSWRIYLGGISRQVV